MATVLVTGAAGFIGSNVVRYWRREHPGDRVVALDALTYAGVRENVEGLDGVEFVHGSIANTELVEHLLRAYGVDVVVNFAAESHNSLAILRPGDFFATNVMGTQGAARGGPPGRGGPVPPHLHLRGLRRPAPRRRRRLHRGLPVPAAHPVQRGQGRR